MLHTTASLGAEPPSAPVPPSPRHDFCIRTVTVFVNLCSSDFAGGGGGLRTAIDAAASAGRRVELALSASGYDVQTVRIATNDFPSYLIPDAPDEPAFERNLSALAGALDDARVTFCSVGRSRIPAHTALVPSIVSASPALSCSADVPTGASLAHAAAAASAAKKIAETDPLGNFRFGSSSRVGDGTFVPFFPGARSDGREDGGVRGFALGLENGALAGKLMEAAGSVERLEKVLREGMTEALLPVVQICSEEAKKCNCKFLGVDPSLNPSLLREGSVGAAFERLSEIRTFGSFGSIAAAAAATSALRSLPIPLVGYKGLMLPVLEDVRLAEIVPEKMSLQSILSISSVCGVGIDTVPLSGEVSVEQLTALMLDVAALAHRYEKPLSCRTFPCPGKIAGDKTDFDSPHLCIGTVCGL